MKPSWKLWESQGSGTEGPSSLWSHCLGRQHVLWWRGHPWCYITLNQLEEQSKCWVSWPMVFTVSWTIFSADQILGRSSVSATDKRGAILFEAVSDRIMDLCSEALEVSPCKSRVYKSQMESRKGLKVRAEEFPEGCSGKVSCDTSQLSLYMHFQIHVIFINRTRCYCKFAFS